MDVLDTEDGENMLMKLEPSYGAIPYPHHVQLSESPFFQSFHYRSDRAFSTALTKRDTSAAAA